MKKKFLKYIIVAIGLISSTLFAQMEERSLTRKGNDFVKDSLFVFAEAEYLKSLDINDFDTNRFNLAFAMLGQEKFEEAISEWEAVEKISKNKVLKSFSVYNIATAYAMQQKIDEAIDNYKQALRYFPKNDAARHNYWFLKLMKDQNPEQKQDDQNKDDQNKDDQNKDDQNKDVQNKDDQNKDDQNKDDQNKDDQNKDDQNKDDQNKDDQNKDDQNKDDQNKDDKESEEEDKSEDKKEDDKESEDEKESDKGDEESEDKPEDNEPKPGESEEPKEGELSKADALRLLESLDKEEDKTQEKIKAKLLKGKNNKKHEKDW